MSQIRDITLFSFSHRNTPLEVRDALAFSPEEVHEFVPEARTALDGEVAVLSTCNRTEFYVFGEGHEVNWDRVAPLLEQTKGIRDHHEVHPLQFRGREAARHLFRVSASIESLALGEDQILAQVKDVHQQILDVGGKSPVLDRLYQFAIRVGKRVRTETELCTGAVSISSAAVELARKIFGDFSDLEVALVGAGETNENAATHLKAAGANRFVVVNRGAERGEALAHAFNGTYRPLDDLLEVARTADIMVFATGSLTHLLTHKDMKQVMKARSYKSIFVIDISNPRNVEPRVADVGGAFVFNIDDLQAVIQENLRERQKEIPVAERIIDDVLDEWDLWMQTMRVRPTIAGLAKFFEQVRQQELARYENKLSEEETALVENFSKGMVKKLLHHPITHLRQSIDEQSLTADDIELVWKLFKLDDLND